MISSFRSAPNSASHQSLQRPARHQGASPAVGRQVSFHSALARLWQGRTVTAAALLLAILVPLLTAGCASSDRSRSGFLEPYKFAIPQGNYLNQQMLDQVREGMSREQVRLAIGSPLLADAFHPDRWDYVFRFQYPNGDAELRRVTIEFRNDRVAGIKADKLPLRDDPDDPALPGYRPKENRA